MRSDSMVVHEDKEKKQINFENDVSSNQNDESSNQVVTSNTNNTIQSLLQSIRDETEKYLVGQEGIFCVFTLLV